MVENINNIKLEIISLFRTNYLNQFHIRKMAEMIGKSHVSLLPHLKKFEEDKILLTKKVGKSKVFSLNFKKNEVREFLSLAEKKKSLEFLSKDLFIKKIYDELINFDLNGCLILFGSYASERQTKESDVDLFYIGEIKNENKKKMINLGKIYGKNIHFISVDLKQFRESLFEQGNLIKEIIKNHIILYNHDIFINELWRYYERKER